MSATVRRVPSGLSRVQRESPELYEWFDFASARFELLDGDAEVLPGLEVIATPGTPRATSAWWCAAAAARSTC